MSDEPKKFSMCISQERLAELIMNDPDDLEVEAGRPVECAQDVLDAIANAAWTSWPKATEAELQEWAMHRGDDAGRAARSYIAEWNRRVPAPAVPDDVAKIVAELRVIGCHENGDARCTCGIGMDAADALEAQAAELARYREALGPFAAVAEHDIGDDETDGEAFRPMQFLNRAPKLTVGDLRRARAALTQPTGD